MELHLGAERAVHGQAFGHLHGGYFSNPDVARPLLDAAVDAWAETRPEVVVDLGGGTGALLTLLKARGLNPEPAFVNLDGSPAQLEVAQTGGIPTVCGVVEDFQRETIVPAEKQTLFLMRSVLHYFGEAGLVPVLDHLRGVAEEGELWVHQTACFESMEDAHCLNEVYRRMHTTKWYPSIQILERYLAAAGWKVLRRLPAPTLHLESADLGARYGVKNKELRRIQEEMAAEFGEQTPVLQMNPSGFRSDLHYHIFVCRAGGE